MRTYLRWWLRQLAELLPRGLVRLSSIGPDAVILDVSQEKIAVSIRQRRELRLVQTVSADRAGFARIADMLAAMRDAPRLLLLRFPLAQCLRKEITLPIAAESDLDTLLGYEMDRETPFAKDEVYWGYRVRRRDVAHGRLEVDLLIIPQVAVAARLEAAREAKLDPSAIEVQITPEATMLIGLGGAPLRWQWQPDRTTIALAAAAAVLLCIAIGSPFIRQHMALVSADAAVASLKAQAEEASALRKSIDAVQDTSAFLNQQRGKIGDALVILAALTQTLPDDTHLTAFSMRGGKITISGLSPSAADLIPLLAHTPPFREPAFVSPVLENQGDGGLEAFTIAVALAAPGGS